MHFSQVHNLLWKEISVVVELVPAFVLCCRKQGKISKLCLSQKEISDRFISDRLDLSSNSNG